MKQKILLKKHEQLVQKKRPVKKEQPGKTSRKWNSQQKLENFAKLSKIKKNNAKIRKGSQNKKILRRLEKPLKSSTN